MLHVVSGNNIEFTNYVREKSFHPGDARYVSNADTLRGLNDINGVFIGTCYDRPDIARIVDCINVIRSRTAKPLIKLDSLIGLSSHSQIKGKNATSLIVDEVQSWSQTNVPSPSYTVITRLSQGTFNTDYTLRAQEYNSYRSCIIAEGRAHYKFDNDYDAEQFRLYSNGEYLTQRYTINVKLTLGLREDHSITRQAEKYNSYLNTESRTIFGETSYTFTSWEEAKHFSIDTSPDSTFGSNCSPALWSDSKKDYYDTSNPYHLDANTVPVLSSVYTVSIPYTEAVTSTFIIPEYVQEALKHARSFSSYITNTWNKTTCCYQYLFTDSTQAASFATTCNGNVTTQ